MYNVPQVVHLPNDQIHANRQFIPTHGLDPRLYMTTSCSYQTLPSVDMKAGTKRFWFRRKEISKESENETPRDFEPLQQRDEAPQCTAY